MADTHSSWSWSPSLTQTFSLLWLIDLWNKKSIKRLVHAFLNILLLLILQILSLLKKSIKDRSSEPNCSTALPFRGELHSLKCIWIYRVVHLNKTIILSIRWCNWVWLRVASRAGDLLDAALSSDQFWLKSNVFHFVFTFFILGYFDLSLSFLIKFEKSWHQILHV